MKILAGGSSGFRTDLAGQRIISQSADRLCGVTGHRAVWLVVADELLELGEHGGIMSVSSRRAHGRPSSGSR